MAKGYYVAHGKAVTTKRGIVAWDSDNPRITSSCLGMAENASEADQKAFAERLGELVEAGSLTHSEGVMLPAPATATKTNTKVAEATEAKATTGGAKGGAKKG